jgi:hypothetical protein
MRKSLIVVAAFMLSTFVASATEVERYETFLGYSFVRFNANSDILPSFNANGGGGQFVYNFNKWIGGVVDLGAVTNGGVSHTNIDATVFNFVAGPRFKFHHDSRFQPFVQCLLGGAYTTASTQLTLPPFAVPPIALPPNIIVDPNLPLSARLVASRTGFALFAGGGLDIKLSKHIAIRPVGADYYLTRMPSAVTGVDRNRNNFRYSAGVNFLFGEQ